MLAWLAAAPAAADPATAKKLTAEANAAAATGDFKTAAETFARAYKEDPSNSDVFCNIGISYFKAGAAPRAHLLLAQCIDRAALDLAFKDKARAVLGSLEDQLRAAGHTPLTVRTNPQNAIVTVVAFGPESEFVGARTLWLPFGSHQLEVRADGFVTETIPVTATDQQPRTVELKIQPKPVGGPTTPAPKAEGRPSKWPAVATSVLAVGAGLFAVISYRKAHDAADRGPFTVDQEAADNLDDEVSTWNTRFGISAAVTIVAAGASGYLWNRAMHTPKTRVEVTPTAGGAAVTFGGRF